MQSMDLEHLLEKTGGSVYNLVVLASKRALEIAEGQPKLVEADPSIKPSIIAIKEIAEGKIKPKKS
jgi:DNA-directed RNA polymerase omega subunit